MVSIEEDDRNNRPKKMAMFISKGKKKNFFLNSGLRRLAVHI